MSVDTAIQTGPQGRGSSDRIPSARADFWFRLFNHATLALAGICLVHGEAYFLPLLPWCLLPYLALLVAAFRAEGRWTLPNAWANLAGIVIVAGIFSWVHYQPGGNNVLKNISGLAHLVPYIGPFLMALLTVQLFRMRGPQDFWILQGMGLVQVALGCVLANSPLFGLLMAVYLASALTCLVLHYLTAPGTIGKAPSRAWLIGFVVRFSLAGGGSALVIFLITPRSQSEVWDPLQRFGNRAPQSARWPASGPNQGANLNGVNPIELTNDEAFSIRVVDGRGPKINLSPDTRFRTFVLETYEDGVWPCDPLAMGYRGMALQRPRHKDLLPDLGHGQFVVHFDINLKDVDGLVLTEPVQLGEPGEKRMPVVLTDFNQPHSPLFFVNTAGTLLPVPNLSWSRYRYKQVVAPTRDPDRYPADIGSDPNYVRGLTKQALPRLEDWTGALLRELVAEKRHGLTEQVLVPNKQWPSAFTVPEEYWELVARALCNHLAHTGGYTYSLEQRRKNLNLDPIEDFLFNVKEGHCERYASALVLMLRTQGIPARLIKGFRGADSQGGGAYIVRKNMAHAWVEVLVKHKGDEAGPAHDWLTLDPTPGVESSRRPSPVAQWWNDRTSAGANMWQRLIVGYNANNQAAVLSAISPPSVLSVIVIDSLKWILPEFLGFVFVTGFVFFRVGRSRRAVSAGVAGAACFARLVRILARNGNLKRSPAQTPRELAAAARIALAGKTSTAELADLPDQVVDLFYRVRFGKESPEGGELARLHSRLDQLARAISRTASAA
jgi:transglutaminase-like putative cysteine protease